MRTTPQAVARAIKRAGWYTGPRTAITVSRGVLGTVAVAVTTRIRADRVAEELRRAGYSVTRNPEAPELLTVAK